MSYAQGFTQSFALTTAPAGTGPEPIDRRREGFAGVAGDLFTSGDRVLVVVADVARRRRGLEEIVAGLAPAAMAVASWTALAADPRLSAAHDHLVAEPIDTPGFSLIAIVAWSVRRD